MQFKKRYSEKGQAVVLMALMMVGLLASLGLAVDGGGYFFLWRDAVNAADAAALSASYARCTNGDMVTAGLNAARGNGFENEGSTVVQVNHPPTMGQSKGDKRYVEVVIEAYKPSYFIQIVYKEPLKIKASAVGICVPAFDPTTVPALWAGSTVCNDTVNWTGSKGTIIGGVFSNKDFKVTGSNATVHEPVEVVGNIDGGNGGKLSFEPSTYTPNTNAEVSEDPLNLDFGMFAPGGEYALKAAKYTAILKPADDRDFKNTPKGNTWNPKPGRMLEGLYYVDGNIELNGVDFGPEGVSLVATGSIQVVAGKGQYVPYYLDGILMFSNMKSATCGENAVKTSGSQSEFHGVIYAPRAGVDIGGSEIDIVGAVIAQTIDFSGSDLDLKYDPSILPPRPPVVQVVE